MPSSRYHTRRHKAKARKSKMSRSRGRSSRRSRRSRGHNQRGGDPTTLAITKQYTEFQRLKGEAPLVKAKASDPDEYGPNTLPGIYFTLNEADMKNHNLVMIVGPRYPIVSEADVKFNKYPLEECLFFFEMGFPDGYPARSPTMNHITPRLSPINPRIHPNLYADDGTGYGKVCLSILGTWEGPGWKPTMSIASTLSTVQSIIGPNIIVNEPFYQSEANGSAVSVNYNMQSFLDALMITLSVYEKVLTADSAEAVNPPFLRSFYDELRERAFTALKFFVRKLTALKKLYPTGFNATLDCHHGQTRRIDFDALLTRVISMLPLVPPELAKEIESEDTSVKSVDDARRTEEQARLAARLQISVSNLANMGAGQGSCPAGGEAAPMPLNVWYGSLSKPLPGPDDFFWTGSGATAAQMNYVANRVAEAGNAGLANRYRAKAATKRKAAASKTAVENASGKIVALVSNAAGNGNGNEPEYDYPNNNE